MGKLLKIFTFYVAILSYPNFAYSQSLPNGWTLQSSSNGTDVYAYNGVEAIIAVSEKDFTPSEIDQAIKTATQEATALNGCQNLPSSKVNELAGRLGRFTETSQVIGDEIRKCSMIALSITPRKMRFAVILENDTSYANANKLALELIQIGFDQSNFQAQATTADAAADSDTELRAIMARIPKSSRPIGFYFKPSFTMSGNMMVSSQEPWLVFANGYATNCFDWDPEKQDPTPNGLAAFSSKCDVFKWRKVGSKYQIIDRDGDTGEPQDITEAKGFAAGQKIDADLTTYSSFTASMWGDGFAPSNILVNTNRLVFDTLGNLGSTSRKFSQMGANSRDRNNTDIARYYLDGYVALVRYPNGTVHKYFVYPFLDEKGNVDLMNWDGLIFGKTDED